MIDSIQNHSNLEKPVSMRDILQHSGEFLER
jgi:hypothetical protein